MKWPWSKPPAARPGPVINVTMHNTPSAADWRRHVRALERSIMATAIGGTSIGFYRPPFDLRSCPRAKFDSRRPAPRVVAS